MRLDTITLGSNWINTKCCGMHKYDRCYCNQCPHQPFSGSPRDGRTIKIRDVTK